MNQHPPTHINSAQSTDELPKVNEEREGMATDAGEGGSEGDGWSERIDNGIKEPRKSEGSIGKRRRTSMNLHDLPLTQPSRQYQSQSHSQSAQSSAIAPSPPPFVPYALTRDRSAADAIASLIHPTSAPPPVLDTGSSFIRPFSPGRHQSSSTTHTSLHSLPSQRATAGSSRHIHLSTPLNPPRSVPSDLELPPLIIPTPLLHLPQASSSTRHSTSPQREIYEDRHVPRRTYTAPQSFRKLPPPQDLASGSQRPPGAIGLVLDERPIFQTAQLSPPLRERSIPPNPSSSSSHLDQQIDRADIGRAWISLGPMEPVDMRQWDQGSRESYQCGYTDALKAMQRGTVGIDGRQYPRPQLVRRDAPIPTTESYQSEDRRRHSSSNPSALYHAEGSARRSRPPAPSSHSRKQSVPRRDFPFSQFYDQHDSQLSTSLWADDRRVEYARYENTHPSPSHRPGGPHAAPAHPGGPYYPAPHPRDYSSAQHPTYGSDPTTTSTSTSPGGLTRTGTRQLISCYPCRSRKMKCDGSKPCAQCVRRGGEAECQFANTVRRRGKGKKAPGSRGGKSGSESDEADMESAESGQESGDERWRKEGMQDGSKAQDEL